MSDRSKPARSRSSTAASSASDEWNTPATSRTSIRSNAVSCEPLIVRLSSPLATWPVAVDLLEFGVDDIVARASGLVAGRSAVGPCHAGALEGLDEAGHRLCERLHPLT